MWGHREKPAVENAFTARVQRIEADCMRRLAFVEVQSERAARLQQHWNPRMTVVDADIMPAGPITRVVETVSNVHAWPWWLFLVIAIVALVVVIGLVVVVA